MKCRSRRRIWDKLRYCTFDKGHEFGHSWQVTVPEKPAMPGPDAPPGAQQEWWSWQVTWLMEESQLGQRPYDMDKGSHHSAAEAELIDKAHDEARREDLLR